MIMGFPIAAAIFWLAVAFLLILNFSSRRHKQNLAKFLSDERDANLSRKKPIDPDAFIVPELKNLPILTNGSHIGSLSYEKQQIAIIFSSKPMIHFREKKTNLEIKRAFGVSNLELVSEYEENFDRYCGFMVDWASALIAEENFFAAEKVLLESIKTGSELTKSYTLLADLYFLQKKHDKLDELLVMASNKNFYDGRNNIKINEHINKMREGV